MSFFSGCVRSQPLRTNIKIGQQHKTWYSFTSQRLFHCRSTVRPQVSPNSTKSPLSSVTGVLWSYFKAPTNVLFITTNLIGIGIVTSYRGLSTLANTTISNENMDEMDTAKSAYNVLQWDFTSNEFLPTRLMKKKDSKILESVDMEIFDDDVLMSERLENTTEGVFIDTSAELPLTEEHLNVIGPVELRNHDKEKSKSLLINYLLMIQSFYGSMNNIFGEKLNLSSSDLARLPETYKEELLQTILKYVDVEQVKSYDNFLEMVPSKDIGKAISSYHAPGVKNQLLRICNDLDCYEADKMENNIAPVKPSPNLMNNFNTILETYSSSNHNDLQLEFFNDVTNLFMNSHPTSISYYMNAMISTMNQYPQNPSFNTLSNIFGVLILKNKKEKLNENTLQNLLKASTYSMNETVFTSCLRNLNIEKEAITSKRQWKARAHRRIKAMTTGSTLNELSYSLKTYILALKGILKFHPTDSEYVLGATKRILFELKLDHKNQVRVNFNHSRTKKAEEVSPKVWNSLSPELIELFLEVAVRFKNVSLLRSSLGIMESSEHIDNNLYIEMIQKIEGRIASFKNAQVTKMIDELKASKLITNDD